MEPYHVWKHLGDALERLLTWDGSLTDRLAAAFDASAQLLMTEDVSGFAPKAQEHLERIRTVAQNSSGPWRSHFERLERVDRERLARDIHAAYVLQREFAGVEKV